jgi:hypothetical protein
MLPTHQDLEVLSANRQAHADIHGFLTISHLADGSWLAVGGPCSSPYVGIPALFGLRLLEKRLKLRRFPALFGGGHSLQAHDIVLFQLARKWCLAQQLSWPLPKCLT